MRASPASITLAALLLSACAGPGDGDGDGAPARGGDVVHVPDAVPRAEPRSSRGNPPFYEVAGHRYYVLGKSTGYRETGVASWYGTKFHGRSTSSGEPYDMYAMTAAHKTLPLPSYVRVTHLGNGRSIVVRVNDRGPFIGERIIDLSYAAAVRLGMHADGTALVDVEALDPGSVPGLPAVPVTEARADSRRTWLQVGAFADARNAERLRARLEAEGIKDVSLAADSRASGTLHRVRVGPLGDVAAIEAMLAKVRAMEIPDAHLAHE